MRRIALFLLISLFAAGCQRKASGGTVTPVTVRIAYTTQHDCALVHLAMAKGFFREEGVAVQPAVVGFGREALIQVLQGKADLATCAETPFVMAALDGEDVTTIGSIFASEKNNGILVVPRAAGTELRGKRIGFTPGTTSELFLSFYLMGHDTKLSEVAKVPMMPERMLAALQEGRVDAVSSWNPNLAVMARALGKEGVVLSDSEIYTENFLVVGRKRYVEEHADAVTRVLRALLRAERLTVSDPQTAQKVTAGELRLPPELLSEFWSAGRYRLSLGHSVVVSLEDESRWVTKHLLGVRGRIPNYLEHIAFAPLAGIKPEGIDVNQVTHETRR